MTEKNKGGRPKLELDPATIEELAAIQCTYAEMSAVMRCHESTLRDRFSDAIEKGRERGKQSLRRAQFQKALGGNPLMLIWLGKQYLQQSDKLDLNRIPDDELIAAAKAALAGSDTAGASGGAADPSCEQMETAARSAN